MVDRSFDCIAQGGVELMATLAHVALIRPDSDQLVIEAVTIPDPGPYQVVVKQLASGICHTQLHQIHGPRPFPLLLGHESCGLVLHTGENVTHVSEGDLVAVTWLPRVPQTDGRLPEICAIPLSDGTSAISQDVFTWADHIIVDEMYIVKLPGEPDPELAAVVGCAVMTGAGAVLHTANVQAGDSVAVMGVGGVGLCAVSAAKVAGADPIIAVDLDAEKLSLAARFGATELVNAADDEPVMAIHKLTRHESEYNVMRQPVSGVDFAFDCVGTPETMSKCIAATRTGAYGTRAGGTTVLVAAQGLEGQVNPIDLLINEKKIMGTLGGSCHPERDLPEFLKWHQEGKLDLGALITKRFRLDQINDAVASLEAGEIGGRAILTF
jgi:Zn-dependent alcohol dehydrogenase